MKARKAVAIIISLTMVFVIFFSLAFIIAEADHDCAGDSCPICQSVGAAEDTLKKISSSVVFTAVAFAAFLIVINNIKVFIGEGITFSPVLLKVKLSD